MISADGIILAVNAAWRASATANGGCLQTCGVGVDYLAICDGATGAWSDGAREVADGLRAVLAGRRPRFEFEYPCDTPTEQRWFSLRVLPQPGGVGAVVSHHDVTALKCSERELSHRSMYDHLTDLPNRALLTDRLEQALAAGTRPQHRVAVAFVALDQFKRVNDNFGHAAGDAVLLEAATRLAQRMRVGDTLARLSGDEFVVVWRDLLLAEDARALAERLAQAFEAPFLLAGAQLAVTASIGVSGDQWSQTAGELILAANAAMQEAKRRGRGRVHFFTPELRERSFAAMRTGLGLRAAMDRNEFVLHYQPVVDLARGAVVGVKALIRWQHPSDGLIGPDLFIPAAEADGMIVELGEWVLEEAAGQAVRWHEDGLRLDMAVNVSTRQVAHPSLVPALSRVLQESGLDPRHLVLEVTESAVMEDAEAAAEVFDAITALGISLAIDDFGTGYSSLVYLKRYLIAALKIDGSFTAGMGVYAEDDAIVASVIGLAKAVGGFCIAEGIETAEQYAALRSLNCGFGQGWLFGKAVAAEDLPDLILACEARLASLEKTMRTDGGEARDQIADQRDQSADQRDQSADERDQTADERDQVADERDHSGDERDHAADERDHSGDERDHSGDERDHAADEREHSGDERVQASDQRDQTSAGLDVGEPVGFVSSPALVRSEAASGRNRASQDRQAGESERSLAGLGRSSARAARGVDASARTLAEVGRDSSLADRGASARSRRTAAHERGVYLPVAGSCSWNERWLGPDAKKRLWCWRSSTSTASRRLMTHAATRPVIGCCSKSRTPWGPRCAHTT